MIREFSKIARSCLLPYKVGYFCYQKKFEFHYSNYICLTTIYFGCIQLYKTIIAFIKASLFNFQIIASENIWKRCQAQIFNSAWNYRAQLGLPKIFNFWILKNDKCVKKLILYNNFQILYEIHLISFRTLKSH